jgi:hypothetical protein
MADWNESFSTVKTCENGVLCAEFLFLDWIGFHSCIVFLSSLSSGNTISAPNDRK